MSQLVTALYQNGVLKPEQPLDLKDSTRVQLVIQPLDEGSDTDEEAWQELQELWRTKSLRSGGALKTRDELHDRR